MPVASLSSPSVVTHVPGERSHTLSFQKVFWPEQQDDGWRVECSGVGKEVGLPCVGPECQAKGFQPLFPVGSGEPLKVSE